MYERFTDRARKILQLANQEAQQFNHECIHPAHILTAIIKEGTGIAANFLQKYPISLQSAREWSLAQFPKGPDTVTMGKLPQTPATKEVIEKAIISSRELGHNYIGTEHMLLGLFVNHRVVEYLLCFNITAQSARDWIVGLNLQSEKKQSESLLSKEEQKVMDLLIATWNEFVKLPVDNEVDTREFAAGIHSLQNIVAARPVFRQMRK